MEVGEKGCGGLAKFRHTLKIGKVENVFSFWSNFWTYYIHAFWQIFAQTKENGSLRILKAQELNRYCFWLTKKEI